MSTTYDVNFHFPVKVLESDRVKLVPFDVSKRLSVAKSYVLTQSCSRK